MDSFDQDPPADRQDGPSKQALKKRPRGRPRLTSPAKKKMKPDAPSLFMTMPLPHKVESTTNAALDGQPERQAQGESNHNQSESDGVRMAHPEDDNSHRQESPRRGPSLQTRPAHISGHGTSQGRAGTVGATAQTMTLPNGPPSFRSPLRRSQRNAHKGGPVHDRYGLLPPNQQADLVAWDPNKTIASVETDEPELEAVPSEESSLEVTPPQPPLNQFFPTPVKPVQDYRSYTLESSIFDDATFASARHSSQPIAIPQFPEAPVDRRQYLAGAPVLAAPGPDVNPHVQAIREEVTSSDDSNANSGACAQSGQPRRLSSPSLSSPNPFALNSGRMPKPKQVMQQLEDQSQGESYDTQVPEPIKIPLGHRERLREVSTERDSEKVTQVVSRAQGQNSITQLRAVLVDSPAVPYQPLPKGKLASRLREPSAMRVDSPPVVLRDIESSEKNSFQRARVDEASEAPVSTRTRLDAIRTRVKGIISILGLGGANEASAARTSSRTDLFEDDSEPVVGRSEGCMTKKPVVPNRREGRPRHETRAESRHKDVPHENRPGSLMGATRITVFHHVRRRWQSINHTALLFALGACLLGVIVSQALMPSETARNRPAVPGLPLRFPNSDFKDPLSGAVVVASSILAGLRYVLFGPQQAPGINDEQFETIKTELSGKILDQLKSLLPDAIHVTRNADGKIQIPAHFWQALRELIMDDEYILTLEESDVGEAEITDNHWTAIESRIRLNDMAGKSDLVAVDVARMIEDRIPPMWEHFTRHNDETVTRLLRQYFDTDIKTQIQGAVKEAQGNRDEVMSKAKLLEFIRQQFANHRKEMDEDLENIRQRLSRIAQQKVITTPGGLTKAEVDAIVRSYTSKLAGQGQLDSLAAAELEAFWLGDLQNRVNFFSPGNGAYIDGEHLSPTWNPYCKSRVFGAIKETWDRAFMRNSVNTLKPPEVALSHSNDVEDCWCAGRSPATRARDSSTTTEYNGIATLPITLSRWVQPEYLVIEHMNPGRVLDPGAAPKDIEIWAAVQKSARKRDVVDWSSFEFRDKGYKAPPLQDDEHVKIGQFRFDEADVKRGHKVYAFGGAMAGLGFYTDSFVVRALNNHGSDHTCFYRIRLYGKLMKQDRLLDYYAGVGRPTDWDSVSAAPTRRFEAERPAPTPTGESGGWVF